MTAILELANVSVAFGGLKALNDVGFRVPKGSITALIGPNGAGKTTCFNVISGLQKAQGKITFLGRDISNAPARRRVGLGRTFQIVQLFGGMTVKESVMVGLSRQGLGGILEIGAGSPRVRRREAEISTKANDILQKLDLLRVANRSAADLPLGQQRMVELARALATDPALLMLDESASGLSPVELVILEEHIRKLVATGVSILLVEHNIKFVSRIADHMIVLNFGEIIFEGPARDGLKTPAVVSAYLGKAAEHA